MQAEVEREMVKAHGRVPGGAATVIAMGKLGGREMTASSDLDLMLIYDFDAEATHVERSQAAPHHPVLYALTQRLISAFTAPTAEGTLYEVDMRLRPSGQKGPVATQLSSFIHYQANEAWTWEHMALTRARVVSGPPPLRAAVEKAIRDVLSKPRDRAKTAADVLDMRARIEKEKGTRDHLGAEAGARRAGRPRVHRPAPATRACRGRPAHLEPEYGDGPAGPAGGGPAAGGMRPKRCCRPPACSTT